MSDRQDVFAQVTAQIEPFNKKGVALSDGTSFAGDLEWADELASKAVAALPHSSVAHFAKGQVLRVQKRYEEAISEFETVLTLNRNWAGAMFALAWCKFYTGLIDETIPLFERLLRLSPRDPYLGIWYSRIGVAHLLQWRLDEAIVWLEKARNVHEVGGVANVDFRDHDGEPIRRPYIDG